MRLDSLASPISPANHRHAQADGMIRRLMIAEPFGGDGTHARWAQNRLRNSLLKDEDGNERGFCLTFGGRVPNHDSSVRW